MRLLRDTLLVLSPTEGEPILGKSSRDKMLAWHRKVRPEEKGNGKTRQHQPAMEHTRTENIHYACRDVTVAAVCMPQLQLASDKSTPS